MCVDSHRNLAAGRTEEVAIPRKPKPEAIPVVAGSRPALTAQPSVQAPVLAARAAVEVVLAPKAEVLPSRGTPALVQTRAKVGELAKAAAMVAPAPVKAAPAPEPVAVVAPASEARFPTELAPESTVEFTLTPKQKNKAVSKQGNNVVIKGGHMLRFAIKGKDTLRVTVVELKRSMSAEVLIDAVRSWLDA